MIADAIKQAFLRAEEEAWWKLYVAVDVHGVIFPSTFKRGDQRKFYPWAKETLKYLSSREDVVLFLWSCSWPEELKELQEFFKKNDISFDYYEENPEVANTTYGFYEKKPYYNLLLDDKAGFTPPDWGVVLREFKKRKTLCQNKK